ncbi:hypothetical protein [Cucumibacter marinus]|uniref:hypothetical protein n=1 Tax=Cucumibacter marinus TaxID=1121252 RepID=UPI0012DE63E1|nr:hypothetical protein [Cucumibacter marinus]
MTMTVLALGLAMFALPDSTVSGAIRATMNFRKIDDSELLLFLNHQDIEEALKTRGNDADPLVIVYTGTSSMRETVFSPEYLSDTVSEVIDRSVDSFNLTSPAQRMVVTLAIAENAACAGADVVVLTVSPSRFRFDENWDVMSYMGITSPAALNYHPALEEAHRPVWTAGSRAKFRVDAMMLIAKAFAGPPVEDPFIPSHHAYLGLKPLGGGAHDRLLQELNERVSIDTYDRGYRILAESVTAAEQCGAKVVFVETPIHPRLFEVSNFAEKLEAHRRRMMPIVGDRPYLWLVDEDLFEREAYYDALHLSTEASMKKATDMIGRMIGQALREDAE